jgi:hypothetical protein
MRTVRAALLTAFVWGIAWALVGTVYGLLVLLRSPPETFDFFAFHGVVTGPMAFLGLAGFLGGGTFAAVMSRAGRGETLDTISPRRAAVWGALGGLAFSSLLTAVIGVNEPGIVLAQWWRFGTLAVVAAGCGALSAAGSMSIARKGTPGLLEEAAAMQRIAGS